MLLLLLAASIPVIGIAGANAVLSYEAELATGPRNAAIIGQVAAGRQLAIIATLRETLQGLARDPRLTQPGCDSLLATLQAIHSQRYSNFWLTDPEGRVLCSGLPIPHGADLSDRAYLRDAIAQRGFVLGEFRQGSRSGQPVLIGALPLLRDGQLQGVLSGGVLLDFLVRSEAGAPLAEAAALPDKPQRIWLVDRAAATLPLTPAAETPDLPEEPLLRQLTAATSQSTGQPISQPLASNSPQTGIRARAALESRSRGGVDYAYAGAGLDQGLSLLVGLPTAQIRQAADRVLLRRGAELAAFLLACLLVIVLGADIAIARPLRELAGRVRRWRAGGPFGGATLRGEPDEVRALEQAFTEAAEAIAAREAELRAALRQRDLLMAEIHHRVKNNLQIVASLLNLQAGRLRDPALRAEFATARDRVQALATLHRHLYTNQTFEVIALRPFLEELGTQLFSALGERPGQRIKLVVEADELEIVTDQAVSLALLVTETVTNAIKHAFPAGRSGTVTIRVRKEGDDVLLTVRDNGLGLRLEEGEGGQGIGMTLIRGFAQHLGGTISMQHQGGTELQLRFALRQRDLEPSAPTAGLKDFAK